MAGFPRFHGWIQHRQRWGVFWPTPAMDRPSEPAQGDFTRIGPAARRRGPVGEDMAMGLEPSSQRRVWRRCCWQTQDRTFAAAALQGLSQSAEDPGAQPQAGLFQKPAEEVRGARAIGLGPVATQHHPSDQRCSQHNRGPGWIQPLMWGEAHRISPGLQWLCPSVPSPK
jgi:hypothetical protein